MSIKIVGTFFKTEFGVDPQPLDLSKAENERISDQFDPAWLAVLLALPGAINAFVDLMKRAQLVRRTDAMLQELKRVLDGRRGIFRVGEKKTLSVEDTSAKQLIEAIESEIEK
ncbi:MAG: hypothetical protein AAGC70_19165 [Pseudomonadota bacterium]